MENTTQNIAGSVPQAAPQDANDLAAPVYNGKRVYTSEDFSYSKAQVGDYVSQEVVDDAMDCVPPTCMSSACSQVGEPHSTRLDPNTGKYRNTYTTFKRVTEGRDGIWQYCGDCFCGETTRRGTEPPYVRLQE